MEEHRDGVTPYKKDLRNKGIISLIIGIILLLYVFLCYNEFDKTTVPITARPVILVSLIVLISMSISLFIIIYRQEDLVLNEEYLSCNGKPYKGEAQFISFKNSKIKLNDVREIEMIYTPRSLDATYLFNLRNGLKQKVHGDHLDDESHFFVVLKRIAAKKDIPIYDLYKKERIV